MTDLVSNCVLLFCVLLLWLVCNALFHSIQHGCFAINICLSICLFCGPRQRPSACDWSPMHYYHINASQCH